MHVKRLLRKTVKSFFSAQWTPWGSWSECTGTCGTNNLRFRARNCSGGFGKNAGQCPNNIATESVVENHFICFRFMDTLLKFNDIPWYLYCNMHLNY